MKQFAMALRVLVFGGISVVRLSEGERVSGRGEVVMREWGVRSWRGVEEACRVRDR